MRSFGEWFNTQASPETEPQDELPEGIVERDGEYLAECCCCHEYKPLFCDISEVPKTGYEHYCGGAPWCCP